MVLHTPSEIKRLRIKVSGVVQGVGFRPFVYRLARRNRLTGFVMNSSSGLLIEVQGGAVDAFVDTLVNAPPPLAAPTEMKTEELAPKGEEQFLILPSLDKGDSTHVSPDVALCDDCLGEMLDPTDRRYLYPFINCTNCGPRYSITLAVPYDRPKTTMADFVMCDTCRQEYTDPHNRRFHAQPNACPDCGPHVVFLYQGEQYTGHEAVDAAIRALKQGLIVAVKGLGGFHLATDAEHAGAVERLRLRKRRNNKAFALMAPDAAHVRPYAHVSDEEEALLTSRERPIVLLKKRDPVMLDQAIASGLSEFGFMLPYTPLHYLLFYQPVTGHDSSLPNFNALVMTSGNLSEEPIVKENASAEKRLASLAEAYLLHNRDIFMRVDDSVVRADAKQTHFIRRARGYVPSSIPLGKQGPEVLACGADLKNTFTLTKGDAAIVSQHIGDMENFEASRFFEESLENLKSVYRVSPEAIAHDLHPGYFSTQWALAQKGVRTWGVQHHYAHIASVMAEKGLSEPVIGLALDGSGYGTDGTVWGGECLIAGLDGFERLGRFKPVPLPGGEAAVRMPWIMAISCLWDAFGEKAFDYVDCLGLKTGERAQSIQNVLNIIENREFSPLTSSAGRLFDAVSALLGLCDTNTYEGEAAMALEAVTASDVTECYSYAISQGKLKEIDFSITIRSIVEDLLEQKDLGVIAAAFHNTVAYAVVDMARSAGAETCIKHVALSGGVFQNRYLLERVMGGLHAAGLIGLTNTKVPCNDGGVSLGQAYLLRETLIRGD